MRQKRRPHRTWYLHAASKQQLDGSSLVVGNTRQRPHRSRRRAAPSSPTGVGGRGDDSTSGWGAASAQHWNHRFLLSQAEKSRLSPAWGLSRRPTSRGLGTKRRQTASSTPACAHQAGPSCGHRCRGMWGGAVFDRRFVGERACEANMEGILASTRFRQPIRYRDSDRTRCHRLFGDREVVRAWTGRVPTSLGCCRRQREAGRAGRTAQPAAVLGRGRFDAYAIA